MAELNELFEEIFHSERKYEAKTDYLKKLNGNIEEAMKNLKKIKEELQNKKGELAVKNNKLVGLEMEVTLLRVRKATFQAQKQELSEETVKLIDSHEAMLKEYTSEKESFNNGLREFCYCYDLTGSGLKYREELEKKHLNSLQEELVLTETELLEIESCIEDMKRLNTELERVEKSLEKEKNVGEALKTHEMEQILLIGHLEKGEDLKDGHPSISSELKCLQAELDACKMSKEEDSCKKLRKDLEDLQEEYYRKQMKLQVQRQSRVQKSSSGLTASKNQRSTIFTAPNTSVEVSKIIEIGSQSDTEDEIWNSVEQMSFSGIENDDEQGSDINDEMEYDNYTFEDKLLSHEGRGATTGFISSSERSDFQKPHAICTPSSYVSNKEKSLVEERFKFSRSKLTKAKSHIKWPYQAVYSPDSNAILRKRPGESIFKTPGSSNDTTIVQGKKKVHFQY